MQAWGGVGGVGWEGVGWSSFYCRRIRNPTNSTPNAFATAWKTIFSDSQIDSNVDENAPHCANLANENQGITINVSSATKTEPIFHRPSAYVNNIDNPACLCACVGIYPCQCERSPDNCTQLSYDEIISESFFIVLIQKGAGRCI